MITLSWPLFYAMFFSHWVIFIAAPIVLFKVRWPIAGGTLMLLSTFMPITGQIWFTDSDSPGLGLLLMLELPIAAAVFLAGVVTTLTRFFRRRWTERNPSR